MQEHGVPNPHEPGFRDYLRMLMRRRKTFLLTCAAVFAAVAVYTLEVKPVYEAATTLHVDGSKGKRGGMDELDIGPNATIESQIAILMARSNAEQVVRRLHLDWQVTKKSKGLSFRLAEVASSSPAPKYHVEITGPGSYAVEDVEGKFQGYGRSGSLLEYQGLRIQIDDLKGKVGDEFFLALVPSNQIATRIMERTRAAELGARTNIIRLSYSDNDPVLARDVVNTLAQVYTEQSISLKSEEASKSLDFIDAQMKSVQGDLDLAEKNLQAYKVSSGIVSLDAVSQLILSKLTEADTQKGRLGIQKSQIQFTIQAIREAIAKGKPYFPTDTEGAAVAGRLFELDAQKRTLLAEFTESHPQVRAVQTQMNDMQRKLLETYEANLQNLGRTEKTVAGQIGRYEGELKKLPVAELQLARLLRVSKVNADIYTFLLQRFEEARIRKASTTSDVTVVDPAITPQAPILPNKPRNLLMGLMAGCLLGLGLVFFKEHMDDSVKDAEMARQVLGAPVLAVIPFIAGNTEGQAEKRHSPSLVTHFEPKSAISEAFRSLRTSIHFSAINKKKQIVLVTSTFPSEGKTTIIANLAVTLVQTGARVLLLDCDLRRPALHQLFGHSKVPGITEILAGDSVIRDVLHNTGISGLDFASAGTSPPNPAELVGSEAMASWLESLRASYDYILLDSPPVLAVTDARLLTSCCDLALIVMETERVPVKAAQRMGELLVNVRAPVAGIVVNDKKGKSLDGYGYYGDSYLGYGYYGDEPSSQKNVPWWRRFIPTASSGK